MLVILFVYSLCVFVCVYVCLCSVFAVGHLILCLLRMCYVYVVLHVCVGCWVVMCRVVIWTCYVLCVRYLFICMCYVYMCMCSCWCVCVSCLLVFLLVCWLVCMRVVVYELVVFVVVYGCQLLCAELLLGRVMCYVYVMCSYVCVLLYV